jgi:hypothetical protein
MVNRRPVTDYDQPDLREAARQARACAYVAKEKPA